MRYPPLKREEMTEAQRRVADAIDQRRVGGLSGPYIPFVYSPEVADRAQMLAEYLRFNLHVPEPLRFLSVLVTARHQSADVELYVHMKNAVVAGLTEAKVKALSQGRRPEGMTDDEEMVYDFCTELHSTGHVKDTTFWRVANRFSREVCLELTVTCGYMALLAMVLNVTETPFPEGAQKPLDPPTLR